MWKRRLFVLLWQGYFLAAAALCGEREHRDKQSPTTSELLAMDLDRLFELRVSTASKFEENLSSAPGVISVITQDELRRFGGVTLREVLERVPGLSGTTGYFTDRNMVAVRGEQTKANGGHILILINGRPAREVLEGGLISDLLESFPVSVLDRIEVIKGPGSVLYGSNAFSRVINLIPKKATGNGFIVSGSGGGGAGYASSVEAMIRQGELEVIAGAQAHQRPDQPLNYHARNLIAGAEYDQVLGYRDRGPGAFAGVNYKGFSFLSSFTESHHPSFVAGAVGETRLRRGFADIGYAWKASDFWEMKLNATYTRNGLAARAFPHIRRDSNEALIEWTNRVRLGERDNLTWGAVYGRAAGKETFLLATPQVVSNGTRAYNSFYAQLEHLLWPNVRVIGGVQANKVQGIDANAVPRAGIVWEAMPGVSVKAIYSAAYRAPSLNEALLNHPGLRGNPELNPETVGTFDVELAWQGSRFQASVNYFHSRLTDSIVEDHSQVIGSFTNSGASRFQGVESWAKYYLGEHWYLTGSTIYQAHTDRWARSLHPTPAPNFGAKWGLSYGSRGHWTASIFDSYYGRPDWPVPAQNPPARAFHLVSGYARKQLRGGPGTTGPGIALFVNAANLLNKQVWQPEWGGVLADTIPVHRGRIVYFGIELSMRKE